MALTIVSSSWMSGESTAAKALRQIKKTMTNMLGDLNACFCHVIYN